MNILIWENNVKEKRLPVQRRATIFHSNRQRCMGLYCFLPFCFLSIITTFYGDSSLSLRTILTAPFDMVSLPIFIPSS